MVTSVLVRGDFGPLTVWVTKEDQDGYVFLDPSEDSNTNPSRTMRKVDLKNMRWVQQLNGDEDKKEADVDDDDEFDEEDDDNDYEEEEEEDDALDYEDDEENM